MRLYRMTPVPDEVFDVYLPELTPGELKVLLVVIRQTLGYRKGKEFKGIDWISGSQMQRKTGYSNRTIAKALTGLTDRKLIQVLDPAGAILLSAQERARSSKLYFRQLLRQTDQGQNEYSVKSNELCDSQPVYKVHPTTDKHTTDTTTTPSFIWKDYLSYLHENPHGPHNIIAYFFEKKGLKFDNKPQAELAVERHLSAAEKVQHFSDPQIVKTVSHLLNVFPAFTVETIYKYLTK